MGYDKRQPKTTGAQTKSRNRISRCKFRRDVGISTYNDHRQALIQLRALDRTKLVNRGEMTVADTYIAHSVDQPRGVGSSKAKDGRAYLWERGFATTGMVYGYSERAGSKRSHKDTGISFFLEMFDCMSDSPLGPSQPEKRQRRNPKPGKKGMLFERTCFIMQLKYCSKEQSTAWYGLGI